MSVSYRYELRRSDEIVATGHLTRERPFEVGDRILIGSKHGVVRTIEPLLGETTFAWSYNSLVPARASHLRLPASPSDDARFDPLTQ